MDAEATSDPDARGRVTEALRLRWPDLPAAVISHHVAEAFSAFEDAAVRDFLPVLVEREVHRRLSAAGRIPSARSGDDEVPGG
ncbi:three-helix bundle dimerization domain-containing protein [Actinoplanes sp. NPDC049681]|uniref:three-helix bundle dimerization domain-containing protein n=1 Tax=Actinoplanes sp. NPDC049681 TaxID=3363905 RepID=UPI0037BD5C7D